MNIVDIAIIIVFVVVNIIVVIRTRCNSNSLNIFAIGDGKKFSDITIVATVVATLCSGSIFVNGIEQTYTQGLVYIIAKIVATPISYVLFTMLVASRVCKLQTLSLFEWFGMIYGDKLRAVLGLSEVSCRIGFLAIQMHICGKAAMIIFHCSDEVYVFVICIFASVFVIYSTFGGIIAVSLTDVVQFIFFGCTIPALLIYMLYVNNWPLLSLVVGNPTMNLCDAFGSSDAIVATLALWIKSGFPWHSTPMYQRAIMCKSPKRAIRLFLIATSVYLVIKLSISLIGLEIYRENPNLSQHDVLLFLMNKYYFVGLHGILFVCLVSLAISTADSTLHAITVVITNDVLHTVDKRLCTRSVAVLVSFIVGAIGVWLTVLNNDIFKLAIKASCFNFPVVSVPMLATILGFKTHKNCIWCGIMFGIFTTAAYIIVMKDIGSNYSSYAFGPGMLANTIALFSSHLIWKYCTQHSHA